MFWKAGPYSAECSKALPRMQAIYYHVGVEQCFPMPHKALSPAEIAMEAFARNVSTRMEALRIGSDRELYRMVKKLYRGEVPGEKTVNNAINARHDAKISTLNSIAEALKLPLWVLLIPDLPSELLHDPDAQRLVRLVQNFLASSGEGRVHIENVAAAAAFQSRRGVQ